MCGLRSSGHISTRWGTDIPIRGIFSHDRYILVIVTEVHRVRLHMSCWERGGHSRAWSGVQNDGSGYTVGWGRSTQVQVRAHVDRKGVGDILRT